MVNFDAILKTFVGEFGTFQRVLCVLLAMVTLPCAYQTIVPAFHFADTDYWCRVPGVERLALEVCGLENNATADNSCAESLKTVTIPREEKVVGCTTVSAFSQCFRYDVNVSQSRDLMSYSSGHDSGASENLTAIECDHGWEYDRSQYKLTVIQEFDLVCGNRNLKAMATSMFIIGVLFGSFVFGLLIDRCGRKRGLMVGVTMMTIHGTVTAFAPSLMVFMVTRFFVGSATFGAYLSGIVLVMEYTGPSKRGVAAMLFAMMFGVGYLFLALYAYLIPYWNKLQLMISVPTALFWSYFCVVPESPRWLLAMGRNKEAEAIIMKCGRLNHRAIPDDVLSESWNPLRVVHDEKRDEDEEAKQKCCFLTIFDVCRLPNMRKKMIILSYIWVVNTLLYYGLPFTISDVTGNDYLNRVVGGVVEILAYCLAMFMLNVPFLGRRWSIFHTMAIAGGACCGMAFVPKCGAGVGIAIALASIGKFCITCSFGMVFVFSAELLPTPVRAVGMGTCSMCGRILGMFGPHLLLMSELWSNLPAVFFGVASMLAGVLVLLLPETHGEDLPETLEEGERFGQEKRPDAYPVLFKTDPDAQTRVAKISESTLKMP